MAVPGQISANLLSGIRGWPRTDGYNLEYKAKLDSSITDLTTVKAGMVVSLTSTGTFQLGCLTSVVMPMILINDPSRNDVRVDGGTMGTDVGAYIAGFPSEVLTALVCQGNYELLSPQYDTAINFTPNMLLTADLVGADAGKLTTGTIGTHTICGVVSAGVIATKNVGQTDALAFWTCFIPAGV